MKNKDLYKTSNQMIQAHQRFCDSHITRSGGDEMTQKEISHSYEIPGRFNVGQIVKFSDGLFKCIKIEAVKHQDKCYWEKTR